MNKKIIILSIVLILAAVVSLLSMSYLWFSSEFNIEIEAPSIGAIPLNLSLDINLLPEQAGYMGQTGKDGGIDSPYYAEFNVDMISNSTDEFNKNLRLSFKHANIKMWNYVPPEGENPAQNYFVLTEQTLIDNFTWRILFEGKTYIPDGNGYMYRIESGRIIYLAMSDNESINYTLRLIYLGEQSYQLWQQAQYSSYEEFAFCDPDYMNATFSFSMEFELNDATQEYDNYLGLDIKDSQFIPKTGSHTINTHIFEYQPGVVPQIDVLDNPKTLKAYIAGVSILKNNNEWEHLTAQDIEDNFTLRIAYDGVTYRPNADPSYLMNMYTQYGQNNLWLTLDSDEKADLTVSVICQNEEDYYNMLLGMAGYPQTLFAYGSSEYNYAVFYYDIYFDMVSEPIASYDYVFNNQVTMGLSDSGYDGKNGSSGGETYTFDTALSWTPQTSNYVRVTITGVTILRTDGVVQTLTSTQINNNFSLSATTSGHTWTPDDRALYPQRKNFLSREVPIIQYEYLSLNSGTQHNVTFKIIYSSSSSFAYTGEQYIGARFLFDVFVEVRGFLG